MKTNCVSAAGVVLAVCLFVPSMVWADVSDNFNDGSFSRFTSGKPDWYFGGDDPNHDPRLPGYDPNLWEPNNPDWTINPFLGESFDADANGTALRLYVMGVMGYGFIGAECSDYDDDANTSTTYFDSAGPHYIVSYVIVVQPGTGMTGVWMHFNQTTWESYAYQYEPWDGWMSITAYSGDDGVGTSDHRYWCVVEDQYLGDPNYYDPNYPTDANYVVDPNYYNDNFHPDHPDPNGFWILFQFDPWGLHQDPRGTIDANDPNCHWLRGAYWRSEDEWDGQWHMEVCVAHPEADPNLFYFPAGTSGFASFSGGDSGLLSDVAYDDFEAKCGYYKQELWKTCALTIKMKDCASLTVSPDFLDDPNNDPNDLGELRRYYKGSPILLDAVVPVGNKVFKKWTIKGPNDASDPAYQIVTDTNQVLYLTMDGDYLVKATCKCGGGGIEPFAAVVLAVLGLGLLIRRLR